MTFSFPWWAPNCIYCYSMSCITSYFQTLFAKFHSTSTQWINPNSKKLHSRCKASDWISLQIELLPLDYRLVLGRLCSQTLSTHRTGCSTLVWIPEVPYRKQKRKTNKMKNSPFFWYAQRWQNFFLCSVLVLHDSQEEAYAAYGFFALDVSSLLYFLH